MAEVTEFSREEAAENMEALADIDYTGRGIVMGVSEDGEKAVQVYWVTGRSAGSKNRVLLEEDGVVRTDTFDKEMAKGQDLDLIVYNALLSVREHAIVSNGHQTDTIADFVGAGDTFADAVLEWEYEPDPPINTPRISGVFTNDRDGSFQMAITKKEPTSDAALHTFKKWSFGSSEPGQASVVHTYKHNGDPVPSFEGSPYDVLVGEDAETTADMYYGMLNPENRVAVVVKTIDRMTGEIALSIVNMHEQEPADI